MWQVVWQVINLLFTLAATLVAVFVGAAVTFFVTWYFYSRAADELKAESRKLRASTQLILRVLKEELRLELTQDEEGWYKGRVLFGKALAAAKSSAEAKLTVVKAGADDN